MRKMLDFDRVEMVRAVRWVTRRSLVALRNGLAALILLSVGATQATAGTATDTIRDMLTEAIRILENQELKKPERAEERARLLERVLGDPFNFEEMSKRALGAHWAKLSDTERREFAQLFRSLLAHTYADRITGYSGEQIYYLNERVEGDYAEVRTKIVSDKAEYPFDYRLLKKSNDWRVYDVIVDGVSLVNNYRGQFTKILRTSSYADLVEQLRKKSERNKSP
ncbi:MAG: MlaC/ttg2D family ABC transporter substrate-binding protein [Nitrospiraceae bacterium]